MKKYLVLAVMILATAACNETQKEENFTVGNGSVYDDCQKPNVRDCELNAYPKDIQK